MAVYPTRWNGPSALTVLTREIERPPVKIAGLPYVRNMPRIVRPRPPTRSQRRRARRRA